MARSRHIAAPVALVAAAIATLPMGAVAQGPDTEPSVRPRAGGTQTTYVLHLTARQDIGVRGAINTVYAVRVDLPAHPTCGRTVRISSARAGEPLTIRLRPPHAAGWCRGRYDGRVLLVRGPHCANSSPSACPRFASVIRGAGRFDFRVG